MDRYPQDVMMSGEARRAFDIDSEKRMEITPEMSPSEARSRVFFCH